MISKHRYASFAFSIAVLGGTACTINSSPRAAAASPDAAADPTTAAADGGGLDGSSSLPGTPGADGTGSLPSGDAERALYVGTWAYQAGSAFIVACPSQPATIVDLSTAGPNGAPGTFELTADSAGGIHEIDGLQCEYDFSIADHAAVAPVVENCTKFPDFRGGTQLLTTDVTAKTTRDGHSMHVHAHAFVGAAKECDLYVEGFALKNGSTAPAAPPSVGGADPAGQPGASPTGNVPDERDRYVGTWSYDKSSALVLACPGQPAHVINLFTAAAGKPGTFALDKSAAGALHELDGLGCNYDMAVVDGAASITTTQTCSHFPDGTGGTELLTTQPTRKASWDGHHMVVAGRAKIGAAQECDLIVSGVATHTP